MFFKKPVKVDVTVTHELEEGTKDYIDRKVDEVKRIVREAFIIIAIGVPCAILFGVVAHAATETILENAASTTQ